MSFTEKQQMIGKASVSQTAASVPVTLSYQPDDYVTYTVKYGDTIWDIAKRFDNVSATDVLTLNNINDPGKIKVGQVLKIKKKS
jgi:LysM repeat protein